MNVLDAMIAHKRREIRAATRELSSPPCPAVPRDFKKAIVRPGRIAIIAELKRKSPSAGLLRQDYEPAVIAQSYEQGGARALSVLTDHRFFGGALGDLQKARAAVNIPVMRKDIIIDERQIHQSAVRGADCVLLIARILELRELAGFLSLSRTLGLAALVEIHDDADLDKALTAGADIVGINNRDLTDLSVDTDRAIRLKPRVPARCVTVSESGIRSPDDVARMRDAGFDAILVGTALMSSPSMPDKLKELVCA